MVLPDLNNAPLDLNYTPLDEDDVHIPAVEEEMLVDQDEETNMEGATSNNRHANLTNEQRWGLYFALEVIKQRDGKVDKTDKQLVACLLKTSLRTVETIWKQANDQIKEGLEVDVSSRKKGNVGRKRKDLDLERILMVPLNKRKTIRSLSRALGVCPSTLHRRFQWGQVKRVTNTLKPLLTAANIIQRLKFCVSMLDENDNEFTTSMPSFKEMDDIVHIDEKWFHMTKKKNSYYLLPGEPPPLRAVQNKNCIGKVMFLTAVAKPRYEGGVVTFDGKIGTWAFVTETPAVKKSKNRPKGTMIVQPLKVTREVMRNYMCNLVIPAIQDKWPDEDVGRTIYIQQDNAKPHILPHDEVFRQAVAQTDLDIRLLQQPPNSPDMNVLDLCFFPSLQSLTDTRAPTSIRELIEDVQQEYENYKVNMLYRSFLTLQACMREVMKAGGGIKYEPPHLHKELKEREGRLPIALSITSELLVKTKELIEKGEAN
jgi:hypothetical protein